MSQNSEVDLFLALHHLGENLFQNTEGKIQKKFYGLVRDLNPGPLAP